MAMEQTEVPTLSNAENVIKNGSEQDIRNFLIETMKKKGKTAGQVFISPEAETKWAERKLDKILQKEYKKGSLISCNVCKIAKCDVKTGPLLKREYGDFEYYVHKNCSC